MGALFIVCWFIAAAVSGVLGVRGLGVSCCCVGVLVLIFFLGLV